MKKIILFYRQSMLKRKQLILIDNPYCKKNKTPEHFLKEFYKLTNDLYEIKIKWIIKKEKFVEFKEQISAPSLHNIRRNMYM